VLVVVLAFYMLLYGDRVWHGLINLLPSQIGIPRLPYGFSELLISQVAGTVHGCDADPNFLVLGSVCAPVCFTDWGSGAHSFIGATLGIGL